jgi:hypothetical protein
VADFAAAFVRKLEKYFRIFLKFFRNRRLDKQRNSFSSLVFINDSSTARPPGCLLGPTLLFLQLERAATNLEARHSLKPRAAIMALFNLRKGGKP